MTLERCTALLKRAGIDPSGYGQAEGETLEQFTARLRGLGEEINPLDFIPVQDLLKEAL